jgi:uncharacterized membrane protein YfcA
LPDFLHPLFVASGFAVGFIVGLTGVGGGSLMTPVLIFLFGVHPGTAVGTDLLYAGGTKMAGTAIHNIHRNVDWPLVGRLALGSLPAAALCLLALGHLGTGSHTANALITRSLGVALGALVTLSSVGAGALGVTALLLLYPRHEVPRIVGSDIAHAVPLTLLAGAGHFAMGQTDLGMLASLLLGSVPGIMIASNIAPRVPEQVLRTALAAVLLLVALRLLF